MRVVRGSSGVAIFGLGAGASSLFWGAGASFGAGGGGAGSSSGGAGGALAAGSGSADSAAFSGAAAPEPWLDHGDDLIDFDFITLGDLGPQDARLGRVDFGGDLVGFESEENVAGIDGLAVLLMPGGKDA